MKYRFMEDHRGIQYCSGEFQSLVSEYGIVPSMSRKGNCWDNAPVESFFGTLKAEEVFGARYASRSDAKTRIFDYIEIFYNRQRLHSSLGYQTPEKFEAKFALTEDHHVA